MVSSTFYEVSFSEKITRPFRWWMRACQGLPGKRKLVAQYWAEVNAVMQAHPGSLTQEDAELSLGPWLKSVAFSQGPLCDAWPRMPFPAIHFLETLLTKKSRVFEYGAGGSSMFFSSRVGELVSVEHDSHWLELTRKAMGKKKQGAKWRGELRLPMQQAQPSGLPPSDPLSYESSDEKLAGLSFHGYASLIDEYDNDYFDVVLVDGRARPSCFMHAMNKVRMGGYIVLDNAERESYRFIEDTAEKLGFEIKEFWGPGPYNPYCWRTVFLRRVRDHFALNDLDHKLAKHLDFDRGIFVEAGANDGIRQSNTMYFETVRGWRGLLVEAIPDLYQQCRRHRPQAKVIWGALAAPEQVPGSVTLRYAGLMSLVRGGMHSSEEEDAHIDAGCEVQKLDTYEVEAPCITLSAALDEAGISHVDLLSLDVEGFEDQALSGLDLSRHRPSYILVEARYRDEIDRRLLPYYEVAEELSHHDILYRLRGLQDNTPINKN